MVFPLMGDGIIMAGKAGQRQKVSVISSPWVLSIRDLYRLELFP